VIYADSGKIRADYYDSEGHVIRYDVQVPKPSAAAFISEEIAAAPRYRLSYEAKENGIVAGKFEIAPPGKAFFAYLQWSTRRAVK
jgi:hypothetical protein